MFMLRQCLQLILSLNYSRGFHFFFFQLNQSSSLNFLYGSWLDIAQKNIIQSNYTNLNSGQHSTLNIVLFKEGYLMKKILEERDNAMVCKVIIFSFEIEHFVVKNLFFDDFMVYIIFICTQFLYQDTIYLFIYIFLLFCRMMNPLFIASSSLRAHKKFKKTYLELVFVLSSLWVVLRVCLANLFCSNTVCIL